MSITSEVANPGRCEAKLQETEKTAFEEMERRVEEEILAPWKEDVREGLLLLMAVVQPMKNKVRLELDYQELNKHVSYHKGGEFIDVCGETLCG